MDPAICTPGHVGNPQSGCTCGGPQGCPFRPHPENHKLNASRWQERRSRRGESRATRRAETWWASGRKKTGIAQAPAARMQFRSTIKWKLPARNATLTMSPRVTSPAPGQTRVMCLLIQHAEKDTASLCDTPAKSANPGSTLRSNQTNPNWGHFTKLLAYTLPKY